MSLRSQFAAIVIVIAGLGGGWFWWQVSQATQSNKVRPKPPQATLVLVEPAQPIEDKIVVRTIGNGEAVISATIYPTVVGEVIEVNFTSGKLVQKGVQLLRMDDKHQRLAVRLAQVSVKESGRQLKRFEKLALSGTTSAARLETAETNFQSAELRLLQAKQDLDDRVVYAPFAGVIGLTKIHAGDRVSEQTPIATLDDRSSILVEFTLPEEYAARVKIGDVISVKPWTDTAREIKGEISETDSRIDPVTRTLRVKAKIANQDNSLRPGASFEVALTFRGRSYPSVREIAVLWSRDGAFLWRLTEGRAEKVFVKIRRRDRGRILVDGPIKDGDLIVVEGVQGLRVGQLLESGSFSAERPAMPGKYDDRDK